MRPHHMHSYKNAAKLAGDNDLQKEHDQRQNANAWSQDTDMGQGSGHDSGNAETDFFGMDGFPAGTFSRNAAGDSELLDEAVMGRMFGQKPDNVRNMNDAGRQNANGQPRSNDTGDDAAQEAMAEDAVPGDREAEFARAVDEAVKKATEDMRLRSAAEMENFKKHLAREHEKQLRYAASAVMQDLLPTLDNLDLALQYSGDNEACKGIVQGVAMTRKLLLDAVGRHGLTQVGEPGEQFSPTRHESVGFEACDGMESGHVARVVQKGYILDDRILRPAKVLITQ